MDDGLLVHYDFNTDPDDKSGNGNDGIVVGPMLAEDRFGNCDYAYSFSQSPDLISIPYSVMDGLTAFSVSMWIKTDRQGVAFTAANTDRNNEFFIQVPSSGGIITTSRADPNRGGQAIQGTMVVSDNEWHHIVVTRSSTDGTMSIFVDNKLDISTNEVVAGNKLPTEPLQIDPNGLYLGNDQDCVGGCWDPNQQWVGNLDDVRIYNRELPADEVSALGNVDEFVSYPSLDLGADISACESEVILDAGPDFDSYLWNTGETTQTIQVSSSGNYNVTTTFLACSFTDHLIVTLIDTPELNLTFDRTTLGCNDEIVIEASEGFNNYVWSNGETDRILRVTTPGTYSVRASNLCGDLISEDVVIISVFDENMIQSNAFSPNRDGTNDFFEIPEALRGSSLEVFNRWGTKIFESQDYQNSWEGEDFPAGTYYYVIKNPCMENPIKNWVKIIR